MAGNWIASQTVKKFIEINNCYWVLWLVVLLTVDIGSHT